MNKSSRGISRVQRLFFLLKFLPLFGALRIADWLAPHLSRAWPKRDQSLPFVPGISIVIPERGTPDLLACTLEALINACARINEPFQIIVVVNGCDPRTYHDLVAKYGDIAWQFHPEPLGYDGAIAAGLRVCRHAWTYLLNSDMRLDANAIKELLPYRQAQVFAITSQIFFEDVTRRREETGWADFHPHHDTALVYERTPEAGTLARGNLYPGGGSSLCRTDLLHRYVCDAHEYHPFYWEDADWGVRAWNEGWEVLFCPTSHAWHAHRATISQLYAAEEIERVIRRNAHWFDLRHAWTALQPMEHIRRIAALDSIYWHEYAGLGRAWRMLCLRLAARRAQARGLRYDRIATDRYYGPRALTLSASSTRPRVLLVAPFALFPPAHGGARRIAEMVSRLADRIDFILLGDERSLYSIASEPWLARLRATHLVEGRGDGVEEPSLTLEQRLARHAWPELRAEVLRLIALYDPDIVQIEFMELARLAEERTDRRPWLLALHDVYLCTDADPANDAMQLAAMARFDCVSACSDEDLALLKHPDSVLINNGAIDRRACYTPSPQAPQLLFMGPFRYAQNRIGISEFLDHCWPSLRARFPDLRLTILGGPESATIAKTDARLNQEGIELVSEFVDPTPYLQRCTLSINPQSDIRGSSIKLIESLLAGRICVSTADGARGFVQENLSSLVVASHIAAMAVPIAELIANIERRHQLERADDIALDRYTWDAVTARQLALYSHLMKRAVA